MKETTSDWEWLSATGSLKDFGDISNSPLITLDSGKKGTPRTPTPSSSDWRRNKPSSSAKKTSGKKKTIQWMDNFQTPIRGLSTEKPTSTQDSVEGTPITPFRNEVAFQASVTPQGTLNEATPLSNAILEEKFTAIEKERLLAYRQKLESAEKELKRLKNCLIEEQRNASQQQETIESLRRQVQVSEKEKNVSRTEETQYLLEKERQETQMYVQQLEKQVQAYQGAQEEPILHGNLRTSEADNRESMVMQSLKKQHYETQACIEPSRIDEEDLYSSELIQKLNIREKEWEASVQYSQELERRVASLQEENENLQQHLENTGKEMQQQLDELAKLCEQASDENDSLVQEMANLKKELVESKNAQIALQDQVNKLEQKREYYINQSEEQKEQHLERERQLLEKQQSLEKQLEQCQQQLEAAMEEQKSLKTHGESQLTTLKQENENLDNELHALKNTCSELREQEVKWISQHQEDQQCIHQNIQEKENLGKELQEWKEKYELAEQKFAKVEEENQRLITKLVEVQNQEEQNYGMWEKVKEECKLLQERLGSQLKSHEAEQKEYEQRIQQVTQEAEYYKQQAEEFCNKSKQIENQFVALQQEIYSLNDQITKQQSDLNVYKREIDECNTENSTLQHELKYQKETVEQLQVMLQQKQDEVERWKEKHCLLNDQFQELKECTRNVESDENLEARIEELSLQVTDLTEQLQRLDEENSKLINGECQTKHKIQFVAKLKEENRQLRNQYLELQSRMRELQRKFAPTPAKSRYRTSQTLSKSSLDENKRKGSSERQRNVVTKEVCKKNVNAVAEDEVQPDHPYLTRSRVPLLSKENQQSI